MKWRGALLHCDQFPPAQKPERRPRSTTPPGTGVCLETARTPIRSLQEEPAAISPGTMGAITNRFHGGSMTHDRSLFRLALAGLLLLGFAGCSAGSGAGNVADGPGSTASEPPGSGSGGSGTGGSGSGASATVTLTSLTANNTAACPANGPLPGYCQQAYPGQTDTRPDVATPEFDAAAGNVSDEDLHGYLNGSTSTQIFANVMLGFCTAVGSSYCDNNVETGYTSDDPNTIAAQAQDLKSRHIDGAILTWEGDGTSEDAAALLFEQYVNQNDCDAQGCSLKYLIMYDGPSWGYNVTATGIPGTSGASCAGETDAAFENCVVAHIRNDMCFMNGAHWGNSAYLKANGRPVVQIFPDESVIPATGPAPSWADVWIQIENWNQDLPGNCGTAPYNAENGVPLIVFENAGGFTHEDSSGSYYWVEPAGTDPATDQFTLNIAPATIAGTLDNFLETAVGTTGELVWSNAFKGFNSSQANWGTGRILDQECGQTWLASLEESNQYFAGPTLSYLQVATWNDYNEGTEIESGIDNCYTVSASAAGGTLSWNLNATSSYASVTTVSHIEIYDSPDGENLTLLMQQPAAASGSWSLSSLAPGTHTLFVRMVGKNSILNRISSGIPYSN
jgi:hypothetical protein